MQDFRRIMKKIGKNILFLMILLVFFVTISKVFENTAIQNDIFVQSRNKSMFRILREPKNTIDVIVLGDSLSYSAVTPMELWDRHGITSYVCGQSGQQIQETYHMLESAFETQSPKLVVLETNAMFRCQPGLAGIKELLEEWGNYYLPIIKNHDIWKSFLINKQYPEENYKGFGFRCIVQPYKKGKYMQETEEKEKIPDVVIAYMEKIQNLCKKNGAKLLLLGTPSPMNYNYRRHNSIQEYADENSLAFLDLNLRLKEVGIDWKTDSLDKGDHLNLSGAQKVTRYLGNYLKEQYELTDHREDDSSIAWKKELEEYRQKAENHLEEMFKK